MVPAHTLYRTEADCDEIHKNKTPQIDHCNALHSGIRTQLTILTTAVSIIVTCIGLSIYAGYSAESLAKDVQNQLSTHEVRQAEVEKSISNSLLRIEKSNNDLYVEIKEQRNMIEDIYKGKTNHNP